MKRYQITRASQLLEGYLTHHTCTLTYRKRVDQLQDGSLMFRSLNHDGLEVNNAELVFKMRFFFWGYVDIPWIIIIIIEISNVRVT